jgi:hypothetical protein
MDTRAVKAAAAAPKRAHSQTANLGNSAKAGQEKDVQMILTCSCAVHRPTPIPTGTDAIRRVFVTMRLTQRMLARLSGSPTRRSTALPDR